METTLTARSEAFAEDLPGYADAATGHDPLQAAADAPLPLLPLLPWLTLALALVGSSILTLFVAPL